MKKTLILLRHAKAESGAPQQDDSERGLIERGIRAAGDMGSYMAKAGIGADLVLCSTATRTRETLRYLQDAYGKKFTTEYNQKLYLASAGEMLNIISAVPENTSALMVVGHNPGLQELAVKLAKKGDNASLDTLAIKFPTCTMAALSFEGTWAMIRHSPATLERMHTPKKMDER